MKVLVAYDPKNGSTTDVAQAIVLRLREHGCSVDIQPTRNVHNVKEFDFLVVGAPIYSGRWHRLKVLAAVRVPVGSAVSRQLFQN